MSKRLRVASVFGYLENTGPHEPGEDFERSIGIIMVGADMTADEIIDACLTNAGLAIFKECERSVKRIKASKFVEEGASNPYFYAWDAADDWNFNEAEGKKYLPKYARMSYFLPEGGR